jgi:GNAT superfamily N-acetyltransferase
MIREWTLEDAKVRNLASFTKRFDEETEFVKTDEDYAHKKYMDMMEKGLAHILVLEDEGIIKGAIGFIVSNDLHEDLKVAVETFWFVAPEFRGGGKALVDAFEAKAVELGCKRTAMIHLADLFPESLEAFYTKRGYKLAEKHYIKKVG